MENNRTVTLKANLRLHHIGNRYMVVESGDNNVDMVNVYTLNESAAWLWEEASKGGRTVETLADGLCAEFDIDHDLALNDVRRQVEEWIEMGLVE